MTRPKVSATQTRLRDARAAARLLTDLGPQGGSAPIRYGVMQSPFRRGPIRGYVLGPSDIPVRGACVLLPGLHYAGPDDVRLLRFARALARSGMHVVAPHLPSFTALTARGAVVDEAKAALDAYFEDPHRPAAFKPMLFSVSFGSLAAYAIAADDHYASRIGGVVTFGGFASFERTVAYCLSAHDPKYDDDAPPRDPLNLPVIYINLAPSLDAPAEVIQFAIAGWTRFIHQTWGRAELKSRARYGPIADAIATSLPAAARSLFLTGCGLTSEAQAMARDALDRMPRRDDLDPAPFVRNARVRIAAFHGRDDDVIPHTELDALGALATSSSAAFRAYKTGLYDHTTSGTDLSWRNARAAAREAITMLEMLRVLVAFSGETDER